MTQIRLHLIAAAAAQAQAKLKVGLMLPYTGTYAWIGTAMENGFRQYVADQGGKLGGREIEFVKVDDESDPSNATDNVNKLIKRDTVDVLIGSLHFGVVMALAGGQGDTGTLLFLPNAGADAVTATQKPWQWRRSAQNCKASVSAAQRAAPA